MKNDLMIYEYREQAEDSGTRFRKTPSRSIVCH